MARANADRFHLPDGPEQQARDAAMASSLGLSPKVDWLYGYDADATDGGRANARLSARPPHQG